MKIFHHSIPRAGRPETKIVPKPQEVQRLAEGELAGCHAEAHYPGSGNQNPNRSNDVIRTLQQLTVKAIIISSSSKEFVTVLGQSR